jgi:hypothetical protein
MERRTYHNESYQFHDIAVSIICIVVFYPILSKHKVSYECYYNISVTPERLYANTLSEFELFRKSSPSFIYTRHDN